MALNLQLPRGLEVRLETEAARLGQSLEEYIIDKLSAIAPGSMTSKSEFFMTFGIIHSLVERTFALRAVARHGDTGTLKGENLLSVVLRELELYSNSVSNFLGALDREAQLRTRKRPVDLVFLIESVVALFDFAAQEKGVKIEFTKAVPELVLPLDCELIQRLLVNIVENAVKYSFSGARHAAKRFISIQLRRHSFRGDYVLSVESYGVGILGEELKHGRIFEYGFRGRLAADRERAGTGIGLAEAKRIVDAHHGHIEIRSTPINSAVDGAYLTTVLVVFPFSLRTKE